MEKKFFTLTNFKFGFMIIFFLIFEYIVVRITMPKINDGYYIRYGWGPVIIFSIVALILAYLAACIFEVYYKKDKK